MDVLKNHMVRTQGEPWWVYAVIGNGIVVTFRLK